MFFQLVILLSLSWLKIVVTEPTELRDGVAFDQVATASENVAQSSQKLEQNNKTFRDQLIPSMIDATIHYENSNGFVPMITSTKKHHDYFQPNGTSLLQKNATTRTDSLNDRRGAIKRVGNVQRTIGKEMDKIEDDPLYSTEARIFLNIPQFSTNRRSFNFPDTQNEFELLKVKNDTPVIANYPDLYEYPHNNVNRENLKADVLPSKRKNRERGKGFEDYVSSYGTDSDQRTDESASYNHHYSYSTPKDKKNVAYEEEKVASNYHQQDATIYDGHGQSATKQNGPTSLSSPRTNQEVSELTRTSIRNNDDNYDNVASPSFNSKSRHRFSRPVVVAEPSNYKLNYKPKSQSTRITDINSDDYPTSRIIDSASAETSNRYTIYNRDGRYRSYEDSRDVSDDMDYMEYTERPRRTQKGRRRPYSTESSKRLPKEHRTSLEDSLEFEHQSKRHNLSRLKSHRQRVKGNSWMDEDRKRGQDESFEETRYDDRLTGSETKATKTQYNSKYKSANTWNQVSPNIEISHSSGFEVDQLEKPKLIVPVKVNLVPVTNFDHATAIGNSQGFDISNAVLQNFVTATPSNAVNTPTPLINTADAVIGQNLGLSSDVRNIHNLQNVGMSTAVPDVIIGQNNFQNAVQPIISQSNGQNKFSSNLRSQFVSSTIAPVFAVTQSLNPNVPGVSVQHAQDTVTPRPTYVATSNTPANVQHVTTNQIQSSVPQLLLPQPTLQSFPSLIRAPVQSSSAYNIQVNPHSLHGQNVVNHGNFQVQNIPTIASVTPMPQTVPVTKVNLVTAESQSRKNLLPGSSTNFLASASFAVGQGDREPIIGNPYYLQNQNTHQIVKPEVQDGLYQVYKNVNLAPKKTYIQTTHLVPAVLHPVPTLTAITENTQHIIPEQQNMQNSNFLLQQPRDPHQYVKAPNNDVDNTMPQWQLQIQRDQMFKNIKVPNLAYQAIDNVVSHTSNKVNTLNTLSGISGIVENAHLPNVGTKNVEILNPNIKPSPIDTTVINTYEAMHYPTAVLTTPIPMFSTTSFVTARPAVVSTTTAETASLQNFVDSLTEMGAKTNQVSVPDLKTYQSQERPVFNPINFIPNMDVVKNQNALNSKLHASEPLQQNLNLVPLIPGGNFFKPSFAAQSELTVKPKLTTDLENYAEQMFKESLKTIYNSQKWNNDRKPSSRQNVSDSLDLSKLRNELQRLKASLTDSKRNKDPFDGHLSESKVKVTESRDKKQDELLAALEQMLKTHSTDSLHGYHGKNRPSRRPNDKSKSNSLSNNEFRDTKHIREFLTPPKPNSHRSKSPFHEKPGKKRPGSGPPRFNSQNHFNGPRSHSRPSNMLSKSVKLETSGTNIDAIRADASRFEGGPYDSRHHDPSEYRKDTFDSYPSITTSLPDNVALKVGKNYQTSNGKEYDINHPRMHNLLGLLMKNKQLPSGSNSNYFQDRDQLKEFFEDEKRRLQQQFYDDTLRDYFLKTSDSSSHSSLRSNITGGRRSS